MAMICKSCGSVRDKAKQEMAGNFWLELGLFCLGIIPGIIYGLWRLTAAKRKYCPVCGSEAIVGLSTPLGQKLHRELAPDRAPTAV